MRYLIVFGFVLMACVAPGQSGRERRGIGQIEQSGGLYGMVKNIPLNETGSGVRIECDYNDTNIWILDSFFMGLSLTIRQVKEIVFLDSEFNSIPGCTFAYSGVGNVHADIAGAFGKCAASIEVLEGVVTVRYKICIVPFHSPSQLIARDVSTTLWLACEYNSTIYADDYYIKPLIKKVEVKGEDQLGGIQISMKRYTNSNCTDLDMSGDVVMPYPVFVGVKLDYGENTGLILQVMDCWAQPTDLPGESRRYNIISPPGCEAPDPNLPGANVIYENYEGIKAKFSFKSFVWSQMPIPGQRIFVYCKVKVCESLIPGSTCTTKPSCAFSRRRRSDLSTGLDSNEKIVKMNPLMIRSQPCDRAKLGCSHECATSRLGAEMCICPEGWTLRQDLKTCRQSVENEETVVIAPMPRYTQDFNVFYLTLLVVLCVAILSGILYVARRPKKKSTFALKQANDI